MSEKFNAVKNLNTQFISSKNILEIFISKNKLAYEYNLQLWVKENIPYVFKDSPWQYCYIREFISTRLRTDVSDIFLIGSAKVGYSTKVNRFGKKFDHKSDLDFTIISESLFKDLKNEAELWINSYNIGVLRPLNAKQAKYWKDNSARIPKNIRKGFLDPKHVPSLSNLKTISKVNSTPFFIKNKLRDFGDCHEQRRISFRIYNSWSAFHKQNMVNFDAISDALLLQNKMTESIVIRLTRKLMALLK